MPQSLHLHAASEAEVASLFGLGTRDDAAARVVLARMVEVSEEDLAYDMAGVDVAGRALLWHPRLPFTGTEDAYWRALEGLVQLASWADLGPEGCEVARDLDDLFTAFDVPAEAAPLALSRRPAVPLPPAEDFDVRVIEHDAARALLQTWLVAEPGTHEELTAFAHAFVALDATTAQAGRAPVDLWLFAPGHAPAVPRLDPPEWPPVTPPDYGPVGEHLRAFLQARPDDIVT